MFRRPHKLFPARAKALLGLFFTGWLLSSCQASYPAASLTAQIPRIAKNELNLDITSQIVGKTLWIYFPSKNLIDPATMSWNTAGLEDVSKIMAIAHRVVLSTDAKLDFVVTVGADNTHYGLEFISIEYIPDLKEVMLERFSRGEYILRSVRDISYNPDALNDPTGSSRRFRDIAFDEFIGLQILHRAKNVFVKDKKISAVYEIKTSSWSQKFGIFKINVECVKKRYDLSPEENKIKPIDILSMIAAQVMKTYDYYGKIQAIDLTDSFSGETVRLSADELKKVKVNLSRLDD